MAIRLAIAGMDEFREALRGVDDPAVLEELRRVWVDVSDLMEVRVRAALPPRIVKAVRSAPRARSAGISTAANPDYALVRIWGSKRRTGWYAAPEYRGGTRQHPAWVGNQWDPGESSGSPYYVGPAINAALPEITDRVAGSIERVMSVAFPD